MFGKIGIAKKRRPQADPQSRRGRLGAIGLSTFMIAGLVATASPASPVAADGGEYKLDFTAAAPETYDHEFGGGAFNLRAVGVNKDIVESLEGGQFECLDFVTYLTQIRRDVTDPTGGPETLRLHFTFLADTTGQSGVAMVRPPASNDPRINYGEVENGGGPGDTDLGIFALAPFTEDGDSEVENVVWGMTAAPFTKGAETTLSLDVTDIEPGERIVLRVDLLLACDQPRPTGNLQAQLAFTDVVAVDGSPITPDRVPGGQQTVPFKQVGGVYPVACPEQDQFFDGQDPSCNVDFLQAVSASLSLVDQSTETSTSSGGGGGGKPVIGTVTKLVGTNPQVSSMFAIGGLIGLVALRRKSGPSRRIAP